MEFKFLDKNGKEALIVKRLTYNTYTLKGKENTQLSNISLQTDAIGVMEYKKNFNLYTQLEYERELSTNTRIEYTVLDLLISANFNLNKVNTGNLNEDNQRDSIGKHQLSMAIKLISNGLDLSSPIKVDK
ncbi:Uncharacterised protein [Staphylococcus aureus]|uniref:hypothetical protein n=1 Tax=Staphylococcus aureus TaxID=1280 RepID=UPI0009145910|nr:hypothetical protein [Staphylococcus aureus]SGU98797.1 Uncharacterised protein [Staphylococcus aureus]